MLLELNEATAARRRIPIALVDDTDGKTPETGITLSAGDLKLSKNGGAEANHAGTLVELAGGDYYYEATQGELDTVGYLTGRLVKSGVRTFRFAVKVVAFDPFDAVRLGLTALPNAAADAAGGLPISDAGGLDLDAQKADVTAILADTAALDSRVPSDPADQSLIIAATDAIMSRLGAPVGASMSADIAVVLAAVLRGEVASGTLAAIAAGTVTLPGGLGINAHARLMIALTGGTNAKGKVRTLQHSGSGDVWNVDRNWDDSSETIPSGTITFVLWALPVDQMIEIDSGLPRFTAAALALAPTGGSAPTAAAIRAEIDANSTQLQAIRADTEDLQAQVGTDGAGLTAIGDARLGNLDAAVSSRATPAQVNAEADTALSDAGVTTARMARLDADVSSRATPAQVGTEAAAVLAAYDPPTAAELAAVQSALAAAIAALPTAVQNADALAGRHYRGGSNTAPTFADALASGLMSIEINGAGTTMTVKHSDGSTAFTRTLSRAALQAILTSTP